MSAIRSSRRNSTASCRTSPDSAWPLATNAILSVHGPVGRTRFHLPLGYVASDARNTAVSKSVAQGKVPAWMCASAPTPGLPRGTINAYLRGPRPARELTHP